MMYEPLSLTLLTRANVSPDWMTLFVANQGIELRTVRTVELPFDAVQEYALDQLAIVAGTPDEWDVFRIADAESLRHGASVLNIFRDLANRTGVSVDHALRKWRYAVLWDALPRIEAETVRAITSQDDEHDYWIYRAYDLITDWGTISSENPLPEVSLSWNEEAIRATFTALKTWLSSEYTLILANR